MSVENDSKGPAVKFPPPLIFVSFIIVAALIQQYWPLSFSGDLFFKVLGVMDILAGLIAILIVKRSFDKVDTEIEPWKPTSAIVSDGLFAYSRNPIYVALGVITLGVGLIYGSFWVMFSFLPAAVVVYFVAIKNEEVYLERKFGDEYLTYKAKVRRWL